MAELGEALDSVVFDAAGLAPAVIQDHESGQVLMVGYMDRTALERTLTTGRVWFWSRSRGEYWRKGDTSGHTQHVKSVAADCDGDALLVRVRQVGPACHTGSRSCFDGRELVLAAPLGEVEGDGEDQGDRRRPSTV
ncbi:MAG: phosphoribosyl-AMP cyclohydrolase [Bifidobacteriaceae bacterium]|jgi:phosphoribosyl-AMP cyclohydrolase|nr:phosphoribosyl-AMP cyclohydrolase [Bifidobacteriaceae bacterium]